MVGESSKPPMESTMISVMPEVSTAGISPTSSSDQASELLAPNPMRVVGDPEAGKAVASRSSFAAVVLDSVKAGSSMGSVPDVEVSLGLGIRDSGSTGDTVVGLAMAAIEAPILKVVLSILGRFPWVVQNRFSRLSELGYGVDDEFGEGEDHEEEQRRYHYEDMTLQRSVDSIGECQSDSGLISFRGRPVKCLTIVMVVERDICVLECDPSSQWEPNELRELVLVQDSTEGTQVTESVPPSNWVSLLM